MNEPLYFVEIYINPEWQTGSYEIVYGPASEDRCNDYVTARHRAEEMNSNSYRVRKAVLS
jgi:hypothetical protein